jgi:hypothetical protein
VSDQNRSNFRLITGFHGFRPLSGSAGGDAESMNLTNLSLFSESILTNAMTLPNCGSQVTTFAAIKTVSATCSLSSTRVTAGNGCRLST